MQETRVWALIQEDPTCLRATKPVGHNYWACALELRNRNYCAHDLQLLKAEGPRAGAPEQERPPKGEAPAKQWKVAPTGCN